MSSLPPPDAFERTWQNPHGFPGWLSTVNNQPLGKRFMLTAGAFFGLAGFFALLLRLQLAVPENTLLGPQRYNELFTMHGSTMMFLVAVPFLEGLAMYLLPMMIGSRDMAYPRLSALSYWTYLFGGLIFYAGFLVGPVPDAGWFSYTPLSTARYAGAGQDLWLLGLGLVEVAGIAAGAEIVVTILKLRAPGLTLSRLPLFAWAMLVTGVMILVAFPILLLATLLLELDRSVGTRLFDTHRGGSSLLWQHLFWFFGHPEVYILFLPASGVISMIVAAFARRISGYALIVVALVLTGFLSFGLWVHHMYATGLPQLSLTFFAAASLMIALASGTQVFAWIASLWGRSPAWRVPLLYVLGFLVTFVIGGLTGVMVAIVPFDWQVHDTYFVVAHFHYVLVGGAVLPFLAGLHYWLPKMTGRLLHERLGQLEFALTMLGLNLTFFPMHQLGLAGMVRRVYTYPASLGLGGLNLLATVGSGILALAFVTLVANLVHSLRRGPAAPADPWQADSLEWSVASPPPSYTFARPPLVAGRHPLWDPAAGPAAGPPGLAAMDRGPQTWRGTLCSTVLDARPEAVQWLPGNTYWPFVAAVGLLVAVAGALFYLVAVIGLGLLITAYGLLRWLQPRRHLQPDAAFAAEVGLPVLADGPRSVGWWGAVGLVVVLVTVAAGVHYSYFYIRLYSPAWPQDGLPRPDGLWGLLTAVPLVAALAGRWLGRHAWRRRRHGLVLASVGLTMLLALLTAGLRLYGLSRLDFAPQQNAYASLVHLVDWMTIGILLGAAAIDGVVLVAYRQGSAWALPLQVATLAGVTAALIGLASVAVVDLSPHVL